jgi:hypothetical protein
MCHAHHFTTITDFQSHTCVHPMTATAVAAVWARGGSFSLRDNSHMPEMRARVDVPCHQNETHVKLQYPLTFNLLQQTACMCTRSV